MDPNKKYLKIHSYTKKKFTVFHVKVTVLQVTFIWISVNKWVKFTVLSPLSAWQKALGPPPSDLSTKTSAGLAQQQSLCQMSTANRSRLKMSLFSSRYHYPFRIRISGLLVVSSAFLTWELVAHPCFFSNLARCWLLHFFVSIYLAFSTVTAQSIRIPHTFSFHEESTRLASDPHLHSSTSLLSSVWLSGNVSLLLPTRTARFRNSRNRHFLFYIYHLDSFHLHEGWSCTKTMKLRRTLLHQSQLSRLRPHHHPVSSTHSSAPPATTAPFTTYLLALSFESIVSPPVDLRFLELNLPVTRIVFRSSASHQQPTKSLPLHSSKFHQGPTRPLYQV
jgi:hypothetical protein